MADAKVMDDVHRHLSDASLALGEVIRQAAFNDAQAAALREAARRLTDAQFVLLRAGRFAARRGGGVGRAGPG